MEHRLPGDAPSSVRALDRRAQRLRRVGRLLEAVDLWTEALSMVRDSSAGGGDWRFVLCWETARALTRLGQLGKASTFYHQGLTFTEEQRSERAWTEGCLLSDLSEVYRRRGEPLEARSLAERALAALGSEDENPPIRLLILSRLGRLNAESGAWDGAERYFQESLDLARSIRGEAHPDYGRSLANLAELYRSCGRMRDARVLGRKHWSWCRSHLGVSHPESISALVALADLQVACRRPIRALILYRHAWWLAEASLNGFPTQSRENLDPPNKVGPGCIYPIESLRAQPPNRNSKLEEASVMNPEPSAPLEESLGEEPLEKEEASPETSQDQIPAPMEVCEPDEKTASGPAKKPTPFGNPVEAEGTQEVNDEGEGFQDEPGATPDLQTPPPNSEATLEERLVELRTALEEKAKRLETAFADKLAFDAHKQSQIDLLHRELQEHKRGLLTQATRPLIAGLVRLHDELGRSAAEVAKGVAEDLGLERFGEILREFQEDVEILLEENGVTAFEEPSVRFDPARQTARRTVPTTDTERAGQIASRLRPGFEKDEKPLMKERVAVYVPASEILKDPSEQA